MSFSRYLEASMRAAVSAGRVLMDSYAEVREVSQKESLRDIVTDADRAAEKKVISILREFDSKIPILAEEQGRIETISTQPSKGLWIVDALDGTVNYANQIPFFCVSIAYLEDGIARAGSIFNPMANDLYYAAQGIGVFKNQSNINVTDRRPEESLFSVAFSGKAFEPARRPAEFLALGAVNDATRGCLRTGSAAMNLAYLAEGKLGGCWGKANKLCDVSAGLLMAKLAGAQIRTHEFSNETGQLVSYLATTPSCWSFMVEKLKNTSIWHKPDMFAQCSNRCFP